MTVDPLRQLTRATTARYPKRLQPVKYHKQPTEYVPKALESLNKYQTDKQVLLSDFNLHHPLWGGLNREITDPESEGLIDIIEDFALYNTLSPGTITYEEGRSQSTIDLCLVIIGLVNKIINSKVDRNLDHNSGRLIITCLRFTNTL
jgi:hypothetical protein